jgi:excinuclease ABC subunit C
VRRISGLSDIPGIGPARQRLLLETFGSMDRVRNASLRDLESVKGIPRGVASRVFDFLHGKNT